MTKDLLNLPVDVVAEMVVLGQRLHDPAFNEWGERCVWLTERVGGLSAGVQRAFHSEFARLVAAAGPGRAT